MWTEKLSHGVLRVLTPLGARYLKPSLFQRFYLLWLFRNFRTLPAKVLNRRQLRFIDGMCSRRGFVPLSAGWEDAPVIGTLEQRPVIENRPSPERRPSATVSDAVRFAANSRQG